ncbi:MAG: MBL fold metallo-hydrolase [Chryseolinea sp.]
MLESLGKSPQGKRLKRISNCPNYSRGSFHNILPTKMLVDGASYIDIMTKFLGKTEDRSPSYLLPSVQTDLRNLPRDLPSLVWFGHSSYLLRINNRNILVDPVFSRRASPFQSVGISSYQVTHPYEASDMPDIDLLIITHDHYDHLDYNTILKIAPKIKKVCTTLGVGAHLEYWGLAPDIINEFDWWESVVVLDNIKLTCTPSRHFSGRLFKRNGTLWSSFVLKTEGLNLFIGGDSGYDEGTFTCIGQEYGPFTLAILECGQYNEMWAHIHMAPEETIKAGLKVQAEVVLPVHWGKFALALHPWREPIERATKAAASSGVTLATPMIGEVMPLHKPFSNTNWWRSDQR